MLRIPLILLIALLAVTTAEGRTLEVRPGEIAAGTVTLPGHDTNLTLTGQLDASDLDRIARDIKDVNTLDLSGAAIVPYKGKRIGANITAAQADILPTGIFAGLRVSHLILPASLTAIGDCALLGSAITGIVIPECVTAVGSHAFAQCTALRDITLPQSVTAIPDGMAEGCEALISAVIPSGVTTIGARAFSGCRSLDHVDLPASLTYIGEEAFAISGLTDADMSGCRWLATIGARTFASCASLSTATLPDGTGIMGDGVFFECKSLTGVRLPSSAVTIPPLTLKGAENVTTLGLPASIASIDTLAFAGMSGLASLRLPATLEHIADGAFESCKGLSLIDGTALPAVPTLGDGVWEGVNQPEVRLNIAPSLENSFLATPQWQDFSISATGILPTLTGTGNSLTAMFHGMSLTITSTAPLCLIELFSTDGQLLTTVSPSDSDTATIDTSAYACHFFIVRVTAASDGSRTVLKLLRQP